MLIKSPEQVLLGWILRVDSQKNMELTQQRGLTFVATTLGVFESTSPVYDPGIGKLESRSCHHSCHFATAS